MSTSKKKKKEPLLMLELPVLPIRDNVAFPKTTTPYFIGREGSIKALENSTANDNRLFALAQRDASEDEPQEDGLYTVGVVGKVHQQVMKLSNNTFRVIFNAEFRARVVKIKSQRGLLIAVVEQIAEQEDFTSPEIEKLAQMVRSTVGNYFKKHNKQMEIVTTIQKGEYTPNQLVDRLAPLLSIDVAAKQEILEEQDIKARLEMLYMRLIEDEENKRMEAKIKARIQSQIGKSHREFYLNEQMKAIQKELGGGEDGKADQSQYDELIKSTDLSKEARDVAKNEVKRLQQLPPYSSEANIVRNYLDWLLAVPWRVFTKDSFDLNNAQQVLDADHFGLEKVKERIIEFIAVSSKLNEMKGPIICLVGPPGVGKTSLARSVAKALNKNFVRFSLGGIRDEAEIRGHRRTYIGAMPGKILQMMKKVKSSNPLILLDEIDKISRSHMGDPAAALLEVLDPEQNNTFMDHFLEVEYDLSKVLFFCTANTTQDIPPALYDRMEIISLTGYTELEKLQIAKWHLIPKQTKENGLKPSQATFKDDALLELIRLYTKESGIRSLERQIGKICRKIVKELITDTKKKRVTVTKAKVLAYLGVAPYSFGMKDKDNEVGVATGLAWTAFGGDILYIEVTEMKGKGALHLTGKLGDVMKESATAAMSYVRSNANRLGIFSSVFQNTDIHVHLPEGATPKDGPSAGITLVTAITSLLADIPVRKDIAMTGEITLRGKVLQIGGLKEKILAAKRSGIFEIIIPKENLRHTEEFSPEVLQDVTLHPVSNISEVLAIALERLPAPVRDEELDELGKSNEISPAPVFPSEKPIQTSI